MSEALGSIPSTTGEKEKKEEKEKRQSKEKREKNVMWSAEME